MRKALDVLRRAYDQDRSQREIARCLALSQSTINEYLRRFTPIPTASMGSSRRFQTAMC